MSTNETMNEYLESYRKVLAHQLSTGDGIARLDGKPWMICTCPECRFNDHPDVRRDHVARYAWAVPNAEAIEAIKALDLPVLEVGAGTGYWAWMLDEAGVRVAAYDECPPHLAINAYFTKDSPVYFDVRFGEANDVVRSWSLASDLSGKPYALMLVWPDYNERFAYDALRLYNGDTFIYVGEGSGGCTGDDAFHDLLREKWTEQVEIDIPQWGGMNDYMTIYRKG